MADSEAVTQMVEAASRAYILAGGDDPDGLYGPEGAMRPLWTIVAAAMQPALASLGVPLEALAGLRAGTMIPIRPRIPDDLLWCVHVRGPDDVHPTPDYETAVTEAEALNKAIAANDATRPVSEHWPVYAHAVPAIWPWNAETHARGGAARPQPNGGSDAGA